MLIFELSYENTMRGKHSWIHVAFASVSVFIYIKRTGIIVMSAVHEKTPLLGASSFVYAKYMDAGEKSQYFCLLLILVWP
jgi:hypothetical protein